MNNPGGGAVRSRGPELGIAGLLLAIGALVVADSLRIGAGWGDDGPRSGYFPFYIGCLLLLSSGLIFVRQLLAWASDQSAFAEHSQIRQVVAVLVPMSIYVAAIFPLGIYVASWLLICFFMWRFGKYRWRLTLPVAIGVPLAFWAVFEKWFLVPLPKGWLGGWLGL